MHGKESHVLCKNNIVRKIVNVVNDGLSKTLIGALSYGMVWVDEASPFIVNGVAIPTGGWGGGSPHCVL